jgi:hypothetical protein
MPCVRWMIGTLLGKRFYPYSYHFTIDLLTVPLLFSFSDSVQEEFMKMLTVQVQCSFLTFITPTEQHGDVDYTIDLSTE